MQLQTRVILLFLCYLSVRGRSTKGLLEDDVDDTSEAEANLGQHYFQGDILSTEDQMRKINNLLFHDSDKQPETRGLIKDIKRTWEKRVVPYEIKDDVDDAGRDIINGAIDHWEKNTCLRFRKRKKDKDYVLFKRGDGCASYVGRIGGKQEIIIGNKRYGCRVGNIIHEIGHTIGFFHEQSRPDRDKFVEIKWKNILREYRINFLRFTNSVINSRNVRYDYGSIMHYPRTIFARDSHQPTVVPKKHNAKIGQRIALSAKDILQAKKLYGCA